MLKNYFISTQWKICMITKRVFVLKVALMHGDMNQVERNEVINAFRKKEYPILVATDVAGKHSTLPCYIKH